MIRTLAQGSLAVAALAAVVAFRAAAASPTPQAPAQTAAQTAPAAAPAFTLTSPSFEDGGVIPAAFTQLVPDPKTPGMAWDQVPAGTVSFVLLAHDPDVSIGRSADDNMHWLVINIPGSARQLPEGQPPTTALPGGGIQLKNTRGSIGYRAPAAPAQGPYHHYVFELFALDVALALSPDAARGDVVEAMKGHVIGKATTVGRFHK